MIILDATTKSLQLKLFSAITTNQLPFSASYIDSTSTATVPTEQDGVSNSTTAVTVVSSPAASTQRLVKSIIIQNADTAAAKVIIIYNNNSTLRNIIVATLAVGDQLIYEDGQGWSCLDASGNIKTSGSGGGGAVSSVSNSDGTLTVSPTTGSVVASLASLASGKILVGNGSNIATGVTMSGDASLANTGAITIANNAVTNAKAAQMAANTIKSNITGSTANASDNSLSAILDADLANTQGDILYRGASAWTALAPGTAGQVLTTGGASANPSWGSVSGAVSSVTNSDGTLTISPTTGGVVASLAQAAANTVLGNLTGSTASPTANTMAATSSALSATAQTYFSGGFVNKFRNPCMAVAQRGTSGTITTGNSAYTGDGWIIGATGATVVWSMNQIGALSSGGPVSPTYGWMLGNTGMTDSFIKQRIEGSVAGSLASQQVTFQCIIDNGTGATVTPTLTVKHAGSLDNWSSPVTDVSAVSLQSVANVAIVTVSYTFTASANAGNGLEVTVDFGSAINANTKTIYFAGFDLRATPGVANGLNSSPPFFEQRPIQVELAYCQRYFSSTFGNGVAPAQNAGLSGSLQAQPYGTTAGELYTQWNFPVQMRANPSITTYNPSASNANWRDKTGSSDVVVSVDPDSAIGLAGVMIGSQTTTPTPGHRCYIHVTASAEL